jgi:hypothetical protein
MAPSQSGSSEGDAAREVKPAVPARDRRNGHRAGDAHAHQPDNLHGSPCGTAIPLTGVKQTAMLRYGNACH